MATKSVTCTISSLYSSYPGGSWSNTLAGSVTAGNCNVIIGSSYVKKNCRSKLCFKTPNVQIDSCNHLILRVPLNEDSYPTTIKACLASNDVSNIGSILNSAGTSIDNANVSALAYSSAYKDSSKTTYPSLYWSSTYGNPDVYFVFSLSGITLDKNTNYYIYLYIFLLSLNLSSYYFHSLLY